MITTRSRSMAKRFIQQGRRNSPKFFQPPQTSVPASGDNPPPFNPQAEQRRVALNQAWSNAIANINQKRGSIWQNYGMTGDTNQDTGEVSNMHIDPNNPYGLIQTTMANQGRELDTANQGAMNRGLMGEGLGAQQGSMLRNMHGGQNAAMQRDLMDAMRGLTESRQQADYDKLSGNQLIDQNIVDQAISDRQFNEPQMPDNWTLDPLGAMMKMLGKPAGRTALTHYVAKKRKKGRH